MSNGEIRSTLRQESLRLEIEQQVAEFLSRGGQIDKLEEPVFSLNKSALVDQDSQLIDDVF